MQTGLRQYGAVTPPTTHPLQCHPATPAGLALTLSVVVSPTQQGLQLVYVVAGNMAALRTPASTKFRPADGLWQHTCLEAFVSVDGEAGYRECNFSPSGQWAMYRFASERIRAAADEGTEAPTVLHTTLNADQMTLTAELPWSALPAQAPEIRVGLSAVIEEADGRLSYWALHHPAERPDFHHPAGRCLRLALPHKPTP